MLIALAILYLSGGSGFWLFPQNFNDRVEEMVMDEKRRETILDLHETITEDAAAYNEEFKATAEKILGMSRAHSVTAKDLQIVVDHLMNERRAAQNKIIDNRLDIAWQIEPEEWEKIFETDKE